MNSDIDVASKYAENIFKGDFTPQEKLTQLLEFRPVRILNERFLNKSPTKKILSYLRNYSIWIASCLKSVHIFSPH